MRLLFFILFIAMFQLLHAAPKFIISGGPCCGKTTVIQALAQKGYQTCPEAFAALYNECKANNTLHDFLPLTIAQRWMLFYKQRELEAALDPSRMAFLDKAIPEVIFFGLYFGVTIPKPLFDAFLACSNEYAIVFFFEQLPQALYETSELRAESYQEAQKIHHTLLQEYKKYPFTLIMVPFDTVQNRVDFILRFVRNYAMQKKCTLL